MATENREVLPANPKPKSYGLVITPNFTDFTFRGEVTINLVSSAPFDRVECNALEIVVESATVTADGFSQTFTTEQVVVDTDKERIAFPLSQALNATDVQLVVRYTGVINNNMNGFYKSTFKDGDTTKHLGTTQFEAVDARKALPCWDEPALKATFRVTLVVPSDLVAVSNTAEKSSTPVDGGLKRVEFEETPIMSTYLLAWTIGEMKCIEKTVAKTRGGETLVRIFATAGKEEQGRFALDVACKVLPLYENFFGSDYILPKVDLLAIPDFACGAMENWGLITYRETALLCDDSSSARHREWVALVVAHELAHQWFGNLVTMEWWKQLWLNESFATWVEYWAVDNIFPAWDIFTTFQNDQTGSAYDLDALLSSHPVEVTVAVAREIDDIFDAISYSKGGSVLRMIIEFIGIDAFQKGVAKYLATFSFSNATTNDLWKYLGEAAGKDLNAVLDAWILQQGYPYLEASMEGEGTLRLTQHRFLSKGPEESLKHDETTWDIPLLLRSAANANEDIRVLFQGRSTTVAVPKGDWVKVNARQAAFCRVKYSPAMIESLQVAIKAMAISNIDRLGLLTDYHAFAAAGFASTVDALRLLAAFSSEQDATVWAAIVDLEADIRSLLQEHSSPADMDVFNAFCQKLYKPTADRIGWEKKASDDHKTAQLRASLLGRLVACNEPGAVALCASLFAARDTAPIDADIRPAVYNAVVKAGGQAEWDTIRAIHESTTDAMERARTLRALGVTRDPAVAQGALEYALSDKVKAQDTYMIMGALAGNPAGKGLYYAAVTTRWAEVFAKYPGTLLSAVFSAMGSWSDGAKADALVAWWGTVDERQRAGAARTFDQSIEGMRVRAQWAARDSTAVIDYLRGL